MGGEGEIICILMENTPKESTCDLKGSPKLLSEVFGYTAIFLALGDAYIH